LQALSSHFRLIVYNAAMMKTGSRQHLIAWIACFAILLNALAPAISHAISAMNGDTSWGVVCTTAGAKTVTATLAAAKTLGGKLPGNPGNSNMQHQEHCPFCATHAGSFALPPSLPASLALSGGHAHYPALFYHAPQPLFSWSAAHPRAPPALA
jgi:hypothetical protein